MFKKKKKKNIIKKKNFKENHFSIGPSQGVPEKSEFLRFVSLNEEKDIVGWKKNQKIYGQIILVTGTVV